MQFLEIHQILYPPHCIHCGLHRLLAEGFPSPFPEVTRGFPKTGSKQDLYWNTYTHTHMHTNKKSKPKQHERSRFSACCFTRVFIYPPDNPMRKDFQYVTVDARARDRYIQLLSLLLSLQITGSGSGGLKCSQHVLLASLSEGYPSLGSNGKHSC